MHSGDWVTQALIFQPIGLGCMALQAAPEHLDNGTYWLKRRWSLSDEWPAPVIRILCFDDLAATLALPS